MNRLLCATHGHCFDGLASAALFGVYLREARPEVVMTVRACGYGAHQPKPEMQGDSFDERAILDFRFAPAPNLSYYYDHHRTAFASTSDEAHFAELHRASPKHYVWDAGAPSCAQLLGNLLGITADERGAGPERLLHWANVIDAARFENAAAACDQQNPILQLASVIEKHGNDAFFGDAVAQLQTQSIHEFATSPKVRKAFGALRPHQERYATLVAERARQEGRVVVLNLADTPIQAVTKFGLYKAFPEATYSVALCAFGGNLKIAVGHNPWSGRTLDRNLGEICAQFGGGGHPFVGGVNFRREDSALAEGALATIVKQLGEGRAYGE
jgi:hypothetical protein